MEGIRSRGSASPARAKPHARDGGSESDAPKLSASTRPKAFYLAALAAAAAVLGCGVGPHLWYRHQLALLEQAGPIGYHLLNGRR
jgi:hypothetical protein